MGLVDKGLNKLVSKKLLVWVVTCFFFAFGMVKPDHWFLITMLYIGGVSVIDITSKFMEMRTNASK